MSSKFRILKDSSTAPLAGNGTWTSQLVNTEQYNHIRGKVYADQAGSLAIQQSDDGTSNWDTVTTIAVTAATPAKFDEICYTNFARLVYTNGATIQGTFRISLYADPFH